jgi:trans-aconitate 2-methyltransferase
MADDTNPVSKQKVEEFYNTFKDHQVKLGVNIRHRTIFKNMKKFGLKPSSNVLEVGCGIGTVSSLILRYLSGSRFVGVDISPENIQQAKKINGSYKNAQFIVNDMSRFESDQKFDFVVLPDVLEHIPIEQHFNLFRVLDSVTTADATVLANFPEPNCLDWARKEHPEKLQIIDQSLSMQDLLNNCYPHHFKLAEMYSYGLQYLEPEYTCVVLKKNMTRDHYHRKSKLELGKENAKSKFF